MATVSIASLGLGNADLTVIGKLSETGLSQVEVADAVVEGDKLKKGNITAGQVGAYSKAEVDNLIDAIPTTDLSGYYNKTEVDNLIDSIPTTDLSGYYTKAEVYNKLESYSKAEVDGLIAGGGADLSDYYTKAQVDSLIDAIPETDLTNYYNKTEVYNKLESYSKVEVDTIIDNIPETDLSNYYKKTEVDSIIDNIPETDLTNYYNKAQVDAIALDKVDKVVGKGLSTEDYTSAEKTKLTGLSNYTKPASEPISYITGLQTALDSKVNKNGVEALHSTDALRISGTTLSLYKGDGTFESVVTQDTVYTLPNASATVLGGIKVGTNLSIDANGVLSANDTNVSFTEISGKPTNLSGYGITDAYTKTQVDNLIPNISTKQDTLVSGTNIKSINGVTLLGSGDMVIGSSNTVIDTFAGVVSTINTGNMILLNSQKYTNNITNYEIATIDTNYIIGINSTAQAAGGNLSKSSNLYILHSLIAGQAGTYYTSANGLTWTKRVNPFGSGNTTTTSYVPVDTATSTYFVAVQNGNTTGYISADGVTWSSFTFSSPPNAIDSSGNIFSYNGTLYIPDNSTSTSFHRITTSYQGKTDYPACGRTHPTSGVLAKTGVGVMMAKDTTGQAGYTFTSDMATFTSHTFPFETVMGTILSNYYDFEKGAFVFISYGTLEAYTSTDLKTFTRSDINVYSINTTNASINKYFSTGINAFNLVSTKWSDMTKYSSIALNLIGSCREKHRLMPNGNMPIAIGLRRNHSNNQTELVLLGKKFNWETDNVKFPVSYIKL